ncbi:MAG: restriction endonuclease subunit S [Maribacter sp.]
MKPYPKYKSSKAIWIDKVPVHWNTIRARFLGQFSKGKGISKKDCISEGKPALLYGDIYKSFDIFFSKALHKISDETSNSSILIGNGTLIFTGSGETLEDIGKSVVYTGDEEIYVGGDGIIFEPVNSNSKFLSYLFNSHPVRSYISKKAKGEIVVHTYSSVIQDIFLPVPSLQEQKSIVDFLDERVSLLNETIADKEKLLNLYEEEKKAIINQGITKGIDPNVKLVDSGVEWLGYIPEHWEIKKLKYLVNEKLMYGANESASDDNPENPRYIRITDFGEDGKLKDNTFKSLEFEKAKDYFLIEGDILFARSGATVGKTFQFSDYGGDACFAGYLIKATPDGSQITSDWLYSFTKSNAYENWKQAIFNQATIQNIGADKYSNLFVPICELKEQKEIIKNINVRFGVIEKKVNYVQKEIKFLNEYKESLIFEAVTGKIDITTHSLN